MKVWHRKLNRGEIIGGYRARKKKKQLACVDDGLTGSVQPLVCRIAEIAQGRMDPVKDPQGHGQRQ